MLKAEHLFNKFFGELDTEKGLLSKRTIKKILEHLTDVPFKEISPDLQNQLVGLYEAGPWREAKDLLKTTSGYEKGDWKNFVENGKSSSPLQDAAWQL